MEKEQQEQYEYARNRIRQKKVLYFHFVFFILASLFMFVANYFEAFGYTSNWAIWLITLWTFLFVLHFIKVYITNRFMDKNWERDQINRLVGLQKQKIIEFQAQIDKEAITK
jgi:hypothetical protein